MGGDNASLTEQVARGRFWAVAMRHRHLLSAAVHGALFTIGLLAAFGLAYNFHYARIWLPEMYLPLLAVALPVKLLVFWKMRLFYGSWRYVGLRDLVAILAAAQISSFIFILVWWVLDIVAPPILGKRLFYSASLGFPQAIFLLDWAATIGLVAASRVGFRFYHEFTRGVNDARGARVLIVGAGDVGEAALREILRSSTTAFEVVGFLDDDLAKLKHRIHGVEVLGTPEAIRETCERLEADEVLIALPGAPPKRIRGLVEQCAGMALRFRTIPAVTDLIEGRVQVSQIRAVDIADLLGRDPVCLDTDAIGKQLTGRRILVTGAGGSIGSEMCRQIARFRPDRLILVEQAENNLFEVHRELVQDHPDLDIVPLVADICDETRMRAVFDSQRPHSVFHAAAHKHVPMMELNPGEAVKNNVVGTRVVAVTAAEFDVQKMVMISTDKAVNPTSIMGCSKRVAEMFVQQFGGRCRTQFVTVRFGNVLGSSGSVIPIFERQIAAGGPVTVTHPDMTRYFMTIPEAAQLVLQAGTMGRGSEIYVLDMGEPVKIVDLAHNMITLSGLRPDEDIEIVFTGMRPGEKLFEELLVDGEHVMPTSHPKIGIWKSRPEDWKALNQAIEHLVGLADGGSAGEIRAQLARIVPEYRPAEPVSEAATASIEEHSQSVAVDE